MGDGNKPEGELERENETLRSRVASLEEQHQRIESENSRLASLYIAAFQLHSTLELREVVQIIVEILLNLVGAKTFAIFVEEEGSLEPVATEGVDIADVPSRAKGAAGGLIGSVFAGRGSYFPAAEAPGNGQRGPGDEPLVCVPLRLSGPTGERIVGTLAVWQFLQQKRELGEVDFEIFNLLGMSAANALEAALCARVAEHHGTPRLRARELLAAL